MIDSHAHLDFEQFDTDRGAVLSRAREAGVEQIITIGCQLSSSRAALALAYEHEEIFATAGVHPHEAARFDDALWSEMEALWQSGEAVAIGEIGLDYFYDFSPLERQHEVFVRQLDASAKTGLPVVIHVRDAFNDFFRLMEAHPPAAGVLHCFTGGPAEAERALALGLYLSISGIATFPRGGHVREAARLVPNDRILVETDAPYLAPVPHRGGRNEPAHVVETARVVAKTRRQDFSELCAHTRENTIRLFSLPC
ncbi:MAG: TatD family hydrolase [Deltaproteobacteria bacterium]|nr:TatD family hydrolase [Deltaproteobacteria bacterium]